MRYKITIEYSGSYFSGWQKQKECLSIQETIENAIYKFSQKKVEIFGSGRTDKGVHAFCQIAHFDLDKEYDENKIKNGINFFLKGFDICILGVQKVDKSFHARFSCKQKTYLYQIINRDEKLTIYKNHFLIVRGDLDVEKIKSSIPFLIGKHDFQSFRSSSCQSKQTIRTIDDIILNQDGSFIYITFKGQSFLQHQIRIMVGTLIEIAKGKKNNILKILESKNRKNSGFTAPPHGLYLKGVEYEK